VLGYQLQHLPVHEYVASFYNQLSFVIRIASITGFAAITSDELYQLD